MNDLQLKGYLPEDAYEKIRGFFKDMGERATVGDILLKVQEADMLAKLQVEFMRDFMGKLIIRQALSSWKEEQPLPDGTKKQMKRAFSVSNPKGDGVRREFVGLGKLTKVEQDEIKNQHNVKIDSHTEFLETWEKVEQLSLFGDDSVNSRAVNPIPESPIEEVYKAAADDAGLELECQHKLGRYRADFAIPDKCVAIEVDGHPWHSSPEQRRKDARKTRAFQKKGWCVVRFTGHEVFHTPQMCINDTEKIIEVYSQPNHERIS